MKIVWLALLGFFLCQCLALFAQGEKEQKAIGKLKLTVVFDNYPHDPRLKTGWGFACLVEGAEKKILFDTGADGGVLLHNMRQVKLEPASIEVVVLSHIHGDHTGGLGKLLEAGCKPVVYLPASFPANFKKQLRGRAKEVVEVKKPTQISKHVYTTAEMGTAIKEQGLVIRTVRGMVVLSGCSHPGIVNMLKHVRDHWKAPIYLSLGGYHLMGKSRGELEEIAAGFKNLGVQKAAPTHCSGDTTRAVFKEAYGSDYIQAGVGKVVEIK